MRTVTLVCILSVSTLAIGYSITGTRKGSASSVFALLGALWIAAVTSLLYAAADTRKDYAGLFAAAIAGATAILGAGIAAQTAADRQRQQLRAEGERHDATLASDRALKDREDLRDVVQDAMRARDLAFRTLRWQDLYTSEEARAKRREAVVALMKAHNRLRIRNDALATAWKATYLQYIKPDNFTLIGPTVESAAKDEDEPYAYFLDLAAPVTRSKLPPENDQ